MKSANANIINALERKYAIKAIPEVIIDWNLNRFVGATAENNPTEESEGFEPELFPISSIVAPNRPTKGINKARIGHATVGMGYFEPANVGNGRFYIADKDDTYKYWTSPVKSDGSGNITKVKPAVSYSKRVRTNKIVIKVENTWASPKTFEIQVSNTTNPSAANDAHWTTIRTSAQLGNSWKASGVITLYWNSLAGDWSGTSRDGTGLTATQEITGIRLVVTALEGGYKITNDGSLKPTTYNTSSVTTGANTFFDLIEISAHLEVDVSEHVISFSTDVDMAEISHLYPLGTITTNSGTLTMSNLYKVGGNWVPGLFSYDNDNSPFTFYTGADRYSLIDANAKITASIKYYDISGTETLLGQVQEFEMYSGAWSGQSQEEVSVELSDFSKFFDSNDAKLRPAMWENLTGTEIIWRILDSVGFTNYEIDYDEDKVVDYTIPVFYTDGEQTVWEVLNELSKETQTAIFFDAYGKLQVKTRDFAFSPDANHVWTFRSENSGLNLANIVEAEVEGEFEPNHYKIVYQKTNWSEANNGQPTMQRVWEPELDVVALRATPLLKSLSSSGEWIKIDPKEVKSWPYEGIVNIQGEIIRYSGKQYVYYVGPNESDKRTKLLKDNDDYVARDKKTLAVYRHKNHFNGFLKITERGVWNSEPRDHNVELAPGWSVRRSLNGGDSVSGKKGFLFDKAHSRIRLTAPGAFNDEKDVMVVTHGSTGDAPYFNYGTRMRFLKDEANTQQVGGIVIHNSGPKEAGYYIEVQAGKKNVGELSIYSRTGGTNKLLDQKNVTILENIDYEIDVDYKLVGSNHRIRVWINGKLASNITVSSDKQTPNGKFGVFIKGQTNAEFEYFYALRRDTTPENTEDFSFLDKVERGYYGQQWDREFVYGWRSGTDTSDVKSEKKKKKRRNAFFDEFGPIVHEVRKYDVKFDPSPVQHSRLFMTNDWAACVIDYRADPFGATFHIANTSRRLAYVHGEDDASFPGTESTIQQVLAVYGRPLVTENVEPVEISNDEQVRRRGKIESEISSNWIQTKGMATGIAEWMKNNFSYGNDTISMEVFGNNLIEISDVVRVEYPSKHISGDYFVVAIENEFDGGLSTRLKLRRRADV